MSWTAQHLLFRGAKHMRKFFSAVKHISAKLLTLERIRDRITMAMLHMYRLTSVTSQRPSIAMEDSEELLTAKRVN